MYDLLNTYFGPLGREYCVYFYLMSMFFLMLSLFSICVVLGIAIFKRKMMTAVFATNSSMIIFNSLLAYYVNRLLNTMCNNSTY